MEKSTADEIIRRQLEDEAGHVDYSNLSEDELLTMLGRALCDVGLVPKKPPQRGSPLSASNLEAKPWFTNLLEDDVGVVVTEAANFEPWVYSTGQMQAAVSLADVKEFFGSLWRVGRKGMDSVLETLCPEMCSADRSGLKPEYKRLVSPLTGSAPIAELGSGIILFLAPNFAVPAVALLAATWLVRVGAEKWCRECVG